MACVLVPTAEAIVSTIVTKVIEKKEKSGFTKHSESGNSKNDVKIPFSKKLKWLNNMLWGGSALLAFEHVWHGEVTPWFPFLTAAADPADAAEMIHEMSTSGVAMAILVTLAWVVMVLVAQAISKKKSPAVAKSTTKT